MFTWLFITVVGAAILLWNRAFLGLWVGPDRYAGMWIDLLIVVIAAEAAFLRVDAYIIDAALQPRSRVVLQAVAAAVTLVAGIAFTHWWGLVGLCTAVVIGRGVMAAGYPILVRTRLGIPAASLLDRMAVTRLVAITGAVWTSAVLLAPRVTPAGWTVWAGGVAATMLVVAAVSLALAPAAARGAILRRLSSIAGRGGPRP
jgi:hypothetical protein